MIHITYYSVADIFDFLYGSKQNNYYNKKTNTSTLTYTYNGKTASLTYNMANVPRETVFWFITRGKNSSFFNGLYGDGTTATLLYHNQRAYVSKTSIMEYFEKVWCKQPEPQPKPSKPHKPLLPNEETNPPTNVPTFVSKEQMQAFGWGNITNQQLDELNRIMGKYEINTSLRIAFFLGNVKLESNRFTRTLEKYETHEDQGIYTAEDYFNKKYGETNGNVLGTNDGELFRGSGFIQLTGRKTYQAFANSIGDQSIMEQGYKIVGGIYNRPVEEIGPQDGLEVIDLGKYAFESAGWFWTNSVNGNLNPYADDLNWYKIGSGINPLAGRENFLKRNVYVNEFYKIYTGNDLMLPEK